MGARAPRGGARRPRSARATAAALATLAAVLAIGSCGPGTGTGHGAVAVLYAGSMEHLMEDVIGPAFTRSTGYSFEGFGAGSDELVSDIKGRVRRADVFVSAASAPDLALEGPANGSWVSWYATFATAPLVIGYSAASRFAREFRTEPWYEVVTQPGILVGRTDPTLDPKGKLTAQAIRQAADRLPDPALTAALATWQVFPEQTLVGRLEAGQLDAGFFYSFEATAQKIPTVPLTPVTLGATFTVTVVNRAPDPAGARAFAAYLLGASGRSRLAAQGVRVEGATLSGPISAVPVALRQLVQARGGG